MTRRRQHPTPHAAPGRHQDPGSASPPAAAADRPWREHFDHVPREFDEGSRRAHYRAHGDHENDHAHGAREPQWPGPPGGGLGPERPHPDGPATASGFGQRFHAPTSGYDDYEAESLYGRGFDEGDWSRTWQRGARGSAVRTRGDDHRGRAPEGYRRSDQRLLEEISERVRDDPYVDGRSISLAVHEGIVRIDGEVEARWVKHHLEHIAARCFGVEDVDNRVAVRRGSD